MFTKLGFTRLVIRELLKRDFDEMMKTLGEDEEESKSSSFCKCKSCENRPPCTPCSKAESVCSGKTDESDIEDDVANRLFI